jgi:ribosomal protein S18 acetylase RimI-like enzyme
MFSIRCLKHSDKKDILELGRQIFREEDEIPLLKKALGSCVIGLSFVAVDGNTIIGFTLVCTEVTKYYYDFMRKIPNCYELAFLGISGKYQGCGLGSRLLKETLVAIFQTSKTFTCWLLVDTINYGAVRLYEKFGFRRWVETSEEITPVPGYIMGLSHTRLKRNNAIVGTCNP